MNELHATVLVQRKNGLCEVGGVVNLVEGKTFLVLDHEAVAWEAIVDAEEVHDVGDSWVIRGKVLKVLLGLGLVLWLQTGSRAVGCGFGVWCCCCFLGLGLLGRFSVFRLLQLTLQRSRIRGIRRLPFSRVCLDHILIRGWDRGVGSRLSNVV